MLNITRFGNFKKSPTLSGIPEPIRILHVITGLNTGGAERSLVKLLQKIDRNNFKFAVVSLMDCGTQGAMINELNVPLFTLGIRKDLSAFRSAIRIRRIIEYFQPDLIHGWMYHGALFSILSNQKRPIVAGIRHSLHDERKEKPLTRIVLRCLRLFSNRVSAMVYCSQISRQQHEKYGFCHKASSVIPNGFDTSVFRPNSDARHNIRKNLDLDPSSFVIGHIARYHPMKDHATFLKAAAIFVQIQKDASFIMVGPGVTPYNKVLIGLSQKLGLFSAIRFLGSRDDIPSLLNALDLFATSSGWGEAFPNVIGEAMASGVPCVATDIGDSRFIIGDTGIVVPPKNPEELAHAWLKFYGKTPDERRKICDAARNRIIEHFDIHAMARKYANLYNSLV
jgi:glycosyltransferase involved in cell wall biosynthesis